MLRELGFRDEQVYAMLGDLTPAQGRREGDRLYREYDAIVHFADARKAVMKCELTDIDHCQPPNDRPDALGLCSSLGEVGIEVADIRPEMSEEELEKLRKAGKDPLPAAAAAALIRRWISIKDTKRQEPGWDRGDNSILLLRMFQDIRKIRDHLKGTNHADFVPANGFKEIWLQDAEYSFWKDGEFLGSAAICIHPADSWLAQRILRVHRGVGLTNKDVYIPLEGPSKGGPLIAFALGKLPEDDDEHS
jgi:hypothetical protein